MSFRFEELQVWQRALDLDEEINQLTKEFPKEEIYILTSQVKRAADSVVLYRRGINRAEQGGIQSIFDLLAKICNRSCQLPVYRTKKRLYRRRKV